MGMTSEARSHNVDGLGPAPEIRSYPSDDAMFAADVQEALARSRATLAAGRELLEAVRRDLRARYPSVEIREQDSLAALSDYPSRWYVYRDGKIA
jgi:hypothetical protein